jgi:hypothetical protein
MQVQCTSKNAVVTVHHNIACSVSNLEVHASKTTSPPATSGHVGVTNSDETIAVASKQKTTNATGRGESYPE